MKLFFGGRNTGRGYNGTKFGPRTHRAIHSEEIFSLWEFRIRHKIYTQLFGVMLLTTRKIFDYDIGEPNPHDKLSSWGDLRQGAAPDSEFTASARFGWKAVAIESRKRLRLIRRPQSNSFSIGEVLSMRRAFIIVATAFLLASIVLSGLLLRCAFSPLLRPIERYVQRGRLSKFHSAARAGFLKGKPHFSAILSR